MTITIPPIVAITEEVQVEILLVHGDFDGGFTSGYWQGVWDMLKIRHPELLENTTVDYPTLHSNDMKILLAVWEFQKQAIEERS